MSDAILAIGLPQGAYPERADPRLSALDRVAGHAAGGLLGWIRARPARWAGLPERVAVEGRELVDLGDGAILRRVDDLRIALRSDGFQPALVARSFALVREMAERTLGQRHYDVQLLGGMVLLNGMVAEMETGEGKTLTATLAASTAALAGIPVHVVTVNDYLAARDAEWMGPVYRALGLTVGVIVHGMDGVARRQAYGCDVTYCSNKEVAFDYLRDRIVLGRDASRVRLQLERLYGDSARVKRLTLRGLYYAIVDEADSVLVDEARTPLIISGGSADGPGGTTERRMYQAALSLAGQLQADRDFVVAENERSVRLTPAGEARLADLGEGLGGLWKGRLRREDLVRQALSAVHLFARDRHYLVRDGKVQIIDEYTGRLMPDRSWEHGLHQLVEAKEGVAVTSRKDALARISYQRFFRRYLRLAGMTGTASEVARELWSVYRLSVVTIPTNRPVHRQAFPDRVYRDADAKWQAVVDRIGEVHADGRPMLIGTRSVAASEHLSAALTAAGLPHQVLNARQDREEATIIARAGEGGRITVATNMAGRGTDIRLGPGVAENGGLHVIATERHEAGRIDRQLFGRCGRQGDPGSYEAIVALDDELMQVYGGGLARWLGSLGGGGRPGGLALRWAQKRAERRHSRARRDLLKLDERLDSLLAFTGRSE